MSEKIMIQLEKKPLTPLFIIALFVSLVEIILGIAVTQTSGAIQMMLTIFVVGFPLIIAGAFFAILWNRPEVLYSPTEFSKETTVTDYVTAHRGKPLEKDKLFDEIKNVVEETITTKIKADLLEVKTSGNTKNEAELINKILNDASEQAVEKIREVGFLTLDSRPLLKSEGRLWQVPYNQYGSVSALLDDIWYSIEILPAFSYGKKWVLHNPLTKLTLAEMGTTRDKKHGRQADNRSLAEAGIKPGMVLEVTNP